MFFVSLGVGVDETARKRFLGLEFEPGQWAIGRTLVGVHCTALTPADFDVMGKYGASVVWSLLNNFLLSGTTTNIKAAKEAGLRIGIGCEWSFAGSRTCLRN